MIKKKCKIDYSINHGLNQPLTIFHTVIFYSKTHQLKSDRTLSSNKTALANAKPAPVLTSETFRNSRTRKKNEINYKILTNNLANFFQFILFFPRDGHLRRFTSAHPASAIILIDSIEHPVLERSIVP